MTKTAAVITLKPNTTPTAQASLPHAFPALLPQNDKQTVYLFSPMAQAWSGQWAWWLHSPVAE